MTVAKQMGSYPSQTPEIQMGPSIAPQQHPRENEGVLLESVTNPTRLFHGRIIAGGDAVDWTLEVPDDLAYDGLVHVIPGYGGIKRSSRQPRHAAVQQGYAALSYEPARHDKGGWWQAALNPQDLHAQTLQAISGDLRTQAPALSRQLPQELDLDKKLLWPHSMGGLAAVKFAKSEPGSIDMIAHTATVGFGHPTVWELATDVPRGILGSARHELLRMARNGDLEFSPRNLSRVINYYVNMRAVFEGRSCVRDDVRSDVADLQDKHGIENDYLGLKHDILVRPSRDVAQFVTKHEILEDAGHLAFIIKAPEVFRRVVAFERGRRAA